MDPFQEFHGRLSDFFSPGVKLTGNELKVLVVLRVASPSRCGLATINREEIAEITRIQLPNISRAIAGLRRKGMIRRTWMDEEKEYCNVYALWTPDEIRDLDAHIQLKDCGKA